MNGLRSKQADAPAEVSKEALAALSSAAWFVVESGKKGGDTTVALEMLQEAKHAYETDDYPRTLELTAQAQEVTRRMMRVQVATEKIQTATATLELARTMGADVTGLEGKLVQAREAAKRGDHGPAVATAQAVELEGGLHVRTALNSLFKALEWLFRAGAAGTEPRREGLRQAREAALRGRATEAYEILTRLLAEVAAMLERPPATEAPLGSAPGRWSPNPATPGNAAPAGSEIETPGGKTRPSPTALPDDAFQEMFTETGKLAESARRFGVSLGISEWLLMDARVLRAKDPVRASELLRAARKGAAATLEGLSPRLLVTAEPWTGQVGVWGEVLLRVTNEGKAVAREVTVRLTGAVEVEGRLEIPAIRANDTARLPVRLRFGQAGRCPVGIEVTWLHPLEGSLQRLVHAVDFEIATVSSRPTSASTGACPACQGRLRAGMAIARCACEAVYHASCAGRIVTCLSCGEGLHPT